MQYMKFLLTTVLIVAGYVARQQKPNEFNGERKKRCCRWKIIPHTIGPKQVNSQQ